MAIGAGSRIGPYEVTALIGEGGMGKVWRAHHAALKRDDALKVLPDAFASDPDRLARFQREAQVLASLNHPNIAHVYGLEQVDGVQALVMELVEGPTLADRVAQGPIPVDEALPIARQIAEALEAAHEQGIIHRDLKPANVKVRHDGTVKVLDFGLAKALEPKGAMSPGVSQSPTITSPAMMTGVGVLLGTAAYMSPEQARGKTVDKRSDIWAFGCVLYEMLAATRAFEGEGVSDTLAFVLTKEPDWSALPKSTPVAVRRLLRRSLIKDRNRRLPDIADARIEIDDAPGERNGVDERASEASRDASGVRTRLGRRVGALVAAAIVVAAMLMMLRSRAPSDVLEMRVDIVTPSTFDPYSFALSPDGRFLAFVGQSDGNSKLWLRSLDQVTARVLAGTEGAAQPFWSRHDRQMLFDPGPRS
jgi:eukaryotic-like serine/threonine-protein kinase